MSQQLILMIANLALVVVTAIYAALTWQMAKASKEATLYAAESAAAARASLRIEFELLPTYGRGGEDARVLSSVLVNNAGAAIVFVHSLKIDGIYEFIGKQGESDTFARRNLTVELETGAGPAMLHPKESTLLQYAGPEVKHPAELVTGVIRYSVSGRGSVIEKSYTLSNAVGRFNRWRNSRSTPYPGSGNYPPGYRSDPTMSQGLVVFDHYDPELAREKTFRSLKRRPRGLT